MMDEEIDDSLANVEDSAFNLTLGTSTSKEIKRRRPIPNRITMMHANSFSSNNNENDSFLLSAVEDQDTFNLKPY